MGWTTFWLNFSQAHLVTEIFLHFGSNCVLSHDTSCLGKKFLPRQVPIEREEILSAGLVARRRRILQPRAATGPFRPQSIEIWEREGIYIYACRTIKSAKNSGVNPSWLGYTTPFKKIPNIVLVVNNIVHQLGLHLLWTCLALKGKSSIFDKTSSFLKISMPQRKNFFPAGARASQCDRIGRNFATLTFLFRGRIFFRRIA
jgi:hypothetical protein